MLQTIMAHPWVSAVIAVLTAILVDRVLKVGLVLSDTRKRRIYAKQIGVDIEDVMSGFNDLPLMRPGLLVLFPGVRRLVFLAFVRYWLRKYQAEREARERARPLTFEQR